MLQEWCSLLIRLAQEDIERRDGRTKKSVIWGIGRKRGWRTAIILGFTSVFLPDVLAGGPLCRDAFKNITLGFSRHYSKISKRNLLKIAPQCVT